MFIFSKADASDFQIDQFEITGSTYEPKGDIMYNGSKFNCSDRSGLVELAECAALCNDSALDFNEVSCFFHFAWSSHVCLSFTLTDKESIRKSG